MSKAMKLDRNGVPINPNDWDYEDWKILWAGMEAVRKAIAARHAEKARAECRGAMNGVAATTPLISIESIAYDADGAALEYYQALYNSSVARIHMSTEQTNLTNQ